MVFIINEMSDYLDNKFLNIDNFYLAFKRLKKHFSQNNEWYDVIELNSYEANLSSNIHKLKEKLQNGSYKTTPLVPLPFPKVNKDKEKIVRPFYKISIDDQIVWLSIINSVGYFFEQEIPDWSYGNRLYRPIWFEEKEGKIKVNKGSISHSSNNIYRKWNQSWPFFKKHIAMTIKAMSKNQKLNVDDFENEDEQNIYINEKENLFKEYKYLDGNYWNSNTSDNLFWLSLDFEKFFPSINTAIILKVFKDILITQEKRDDVDLILKTVEEALVYKIDSTLYEDVSFLHDINSFNLNDTAFCNGLPTGLLASGFLSNIALLDIDKKLSHWIENRKDIALFKYVDDHIIISYSYQTINDFVDYYIDELKNSGLNIFFNKDKIEPKDSCKLENGIFSFIDTEKNKLDIDFPEPLMTHTLKKMSNLNGNDFNLMNSEELNIAENDLIHFLLAEFSDTEIRRDTRMSFSALKLCQLSKFITPDFSSFDINFNREINIENVEEFKKIEILRIEKKYDKIFNLLLKATHENPDKLKLWKRLIDFLVISGLNKFEDIFKIIDNTNIHDLSKSYLKSYILNLISLNLIQCKNSIMNKNVSFWIKNRNELFIKNCEVIVSQELSKNNIFSPNFFEITHDFVTKGIIEENDNFESNLHFFISSIKNNKEFWTINYEKISLDCPISWSILNFYPNEISVDFFKKIHEYNLPLLNQTFEERIKSTSSIIFERFSFLNNDDVILFDIFNKNKIIYKDFIKEYPKIEKKIKKEHKHYIDIEGWYKKGLNQSKNKAWIDIRFSEWSILEVIKQIAMQKMALKVDKNIFDFNDKTYFVHPHNFLIPKKWLVSPESLSWDEWKKIVAENPVKLEDNKCCVEDYRYVPTSYYWKQANLYTFFYDTGFMPLILGLSTLLLKMLSKSFDWHSSSNKVYFLDKFYNDVLILIQEQPISSELRYLLNSIFSKNESSFNNYHNNFDYKGKNINNLKEFIVIIEAIQKKLEQGQISLSNNAPRQLTIIEIDLLKPENNI